MNSATSMMKDEMTADEVTHYNSFLLSPITFWWVLMIWRWCLL